MIIALHVGMRGDADEAVSSLLADQNQQLANAGWTVPTDMPDGDAETDIEQIAAAWCEWVDAARAQGADKIAISDPRFTEGHFVQGEVARFVGALRHRGSLRAVGITRRLDDHIASSYIRQLRAGRTAPMRKRELTGSGKLYNYFPRLERWISAMSDDFVIIHCPTSADPRVVLPSVAASLGLPTPQSTDFAAPVLTPDAAEAMRQINQRLEQFNPSDESSHEIRAAAFQHLVGLSEGDEPLRMSPDAAAAVLDRYRAAAGSLTRAMSPADAERFMSSELPPEVSCDGERSATLATEVLSGLGVERTTTHRQDKGKPPRALLRQAVRQARRAFDSGDDDVYAANLARIQGLFRQIPRYREQIPASDTSAQIPNRLVQYWDPWPPPEELLPWLQSWSDIGMRGGVHQVVSLDEATATMAAAAGERGVDAFQMAPHPAARADLYRYAELFLHGGWYVDAEHEALLPIADVHPWPVDHVLVIRAGEDRVPNGYIGAVPNSQLMRAALDKACTNVLERRGSRVIEMTGPDMFTPLVLAYLDQPDASYVLLPTTAVFDILQIVHNEAAYKAGSHWRDHDLTDD